MSRRASLGRSNGSSTGWGYDAASNLTSLTQTMPPGQSAYNLSLTYTYTVANQLYTRTASTTAYDFNAFPTSQAKTYDGLNRDAAIAALSGGG